MIVVVNGQRVEVQGRLDLRLEIDPGGEEFGGLRLEVAGGVATFRGDPGLFITNSGGGGLVFEGRANAAVVLYGGEGNPPTIIFQVTAGPVLVTNCPPVSAAPEHP
jgi:hypothetical protein